MDVRPDQALYVLGFSLTTLELTPDLYWLKSAEVTSSVHQSVRYWFKVIDRGDFEGTEAESNLASIEWLTPRVLAHDAAVSALSKAAPFYPAGFGTLFSSHEAISKLLDAESLNLTNYLASVCGREEWGIKCMADMQISVLKYAEKEGLNPSASVTSGKDYLKSKQILKSIDGKTKQWLNDLTFSIQQTLEALFGEVVVRSRSSQAERTQQDELISSLAVLSLQSESDKLNQWIESWNATQFAQTGLSLELTGPWPPYSFCPSLTGSE